MIICEYLRILLVRKRNAEIVAFFFSAEAAPPRIRGSLVSCYQLAITLGILIAQLADLGMEKIQSSASWRVPVGLQLLWGLMLLVGCLFIVSHSFATFLA